MGKNFLIDSNVLLEFLAGTFTENAHKFVENSINMSFNISIINRIEVLGHESATQDLTDFMDLAFTYQLTKEVEIETIKIRKYKKIKLPDAIIAATALVYDLTLITRNTADFKNIENLNMIDPINQ